MVISVTSFFVVLRDVVNGGETEEVIKARASSNVVPGMLICAREDQVNIASYQEDCFSCSGWGT